MMCLACEQDAMWFAYLQRKGLITPDGYLVEPPPSLADPVETVPAPASASAEKPEQTTSESVDKTNNFSCDDPAAQ
jgi:hypothetical protein